MFHKILIANRGEIALRIIRACKELGIATVAIYSEADRDSLHVRLADEAYCVGPPSSARSYLNIPNIMSAAVIAEADAIHPGYGYLSEQAHFAEICETHDIKFIGPSAAVIEKMGNKSTAKQIMRDAGVPVVPGEDDPVLDDAEALSVAETIGYPIIMKAAAGGGGKGMRVARSSQELVRMLGPARAEAQAAFGNSDVYLEKFFERPRHIEIQLLADEHGHCVHLGERECSLQRRHQKVLEEAPSSFLTEDLRAAMGDAAVQGAKAVEYANAGTMEFLVEDGHFYFMEMNTRIQVEHPVTEMVTGVDLVKLQIAVAAGEPLPFTQEEVTIRGYAIECRINAEDVDNRFMPSPGTISFYHPPGGPGVRVDSAGFTGYTVTPFYDSMIGKLIVKGDDRLEAIRKMRVALDEFFIAGVKTTLPLHRRLMELDNFIHGDFSTTSLDQWLNDDKELEAR